MPRHIIFFFARLVAGLTLCVAVLAAPAQQASFDFREVGVSQAIGLIYGEVIKGSYVIDPAVVDDKRLVSFRFVRGSSEVRAFVSSFLDSLGFDLVSRGGIDFISLKVKPVDSPAPDAKNVFVYRPKNRDANALARVLSPLFKSGSFAQTRSIPNPVAPRSDLPSSAVSDSSAAGLLEQASDVLVFVGTSAEVQQLVAVLPQLDLPLGEVVIKSVLYEVVGSSGRGSAFRGLVSLLGGRFGFVSGATVPAAADAFKLDTKNFSAVLGFLDTDSSLRSIASPTLRIRSGSSGRFSVGEKVPTLGAVAQNQTGSSFQSVVYQNAGVILDLSPHVRDVLIDLNIKQQVSNFRATSTGVNNSPTQSLREVQTSVTVSDGEIVVLGGLDLTSDSSTSAGAAFFPSFIRSSSSDKSNTEIVLLLQVQRLARSPL